MVTSVSSCCFRNRLLWSRGNDLTGRERYINNCVKIEQEVRKEKGRVKERTCRLRVLRGFHVPQHFCFQGSGSSRVLPTRAVEYRLDVAASPQSG